MKLRLRQYTLSVVMFVLLLGVLVSMDDRVRDCFREVVRASSPASLANRVANLRDAATDALRVQSLENGPLLAFAMVGGVLFLFMFRT